MKITYRHARRPDVIGLTSLDNYMQLHHRYRNILTDLLPLGIPVPVNTRLRCQAVTTCELSPEDGEFFEPVVGAAFCCDKDQFSRKIGRQIAKGRATATLYAARKTEIIDLCEATNPRDAVGDILEMCHRRITEYDLEKSREDFKGTKQRGTKKEQ